MAIRIFNITSKLNLLPNIPVNIEIREKLLNNLILLTTELFIDIKNLLQSNSFYNVMIDDKNEKMLMKNFYILNYSQKFLVQKIELDLYYYTSVFIEAQRVLSTMDTKILIILNGIKI